MKYINLDNVCEFVRNGASIKQDSQCNEGIPITRIETISNDKFNFDRLGYANIKDDKYSDYYLKDKDVLLSHINSAKYLGRSVLYRKKDENPIIHGMNLLCLRFIKDKYLPDYFVYYSQSNVAKAYIQKHTKLAVNQASITSTAIKDMPIPMIEMGKQKEISKSLDKCNEIIHKHKQLLSKYDFLIKSRFIEMFGDNPTKNEKWKVEKLGNLGLCKNGMNFSYEDNGFEINCLGVGDFKDNAVITNCEDLPVISLNEKPSEEYLLQDNDIVFVRSNGNKELVGRSVLIHPTVLTTFSGFCIRFRLSTNAINHLFLLQFLKMPNTRKNMAGRGANIQNLNQQILSNLDIPVPQIELQNDFAAFVQQIDKSKFEIWLYINMCYIIKKRVFTYD